MWTRTAFLKVTVRLSKPYLQRTQKGTGRAGLPRTEQRLDSLGAGRGPGCLLPAVITPVRRGGFDTAGPVPGSGSFASRDPSCSRRPSTHPKALALILCSPCKARGRSETCKWHSERGFQTHPPQIPCPLAHNVGLAFPRHQPARAPSGGSRHPCLGFQPTRPPLIGVILLAVATVCWAVPVPSDSKKDDAELKKRAFCGGDPTPQCHGRRHGGHH
ncbi:uncharacterized protein VTP21DRAFT_8582 [Calcarisporiella thermophila]|uniref:uncharacterized protein n=1 Tax=Calcarisporiella thermophila TaxID=911321 RepID=UPI0037426C31